MSDSEKLAAAIRTRLNFAMVKVQKGWEDRSIDQIEADTNNRPDKSGATEASKTTRKITETNLSTPPRKTHARSDISAAAIGRTVGQSPAKDQSPSSSGVRSADSSPRVSQASFAVQPHPGAANTGLGLSIPTSPTPRRRPSKRGHRRSTSDILHNSTGGVSGVFKVDKPQERLWQGHPMQSPYSPQKYHVPLQGYQQPQQQQPPPPPQHYQQAPPGPPPPHLHYPQAPPPLHDMQRSPTVAPTGMVHQPPPQHSLGQAFQPQQPQPQQRQYNYTHAPVYGSSPPSQYNNNNGHFAGHIQSHSPTRPSPLHGPPQTPPTSNPTSASGAGGARPTLAPLHVPLPSISTSINSPTSAPERVTLPPMRAIYDSPGMPYGDVTSPRAHLPSPAPHSPGQREVDDDAAESLMYFSSPRR